MLSDISNFTILLGPKQAGVFENCKSNYRNIWPVFFRYFSVIGFANFKKDVCLRCETVKSSKIQFRAPKDFGPLFGPQLKLKSRKISQKSFKTVCFRFVNLSTRNWNYSRKQFFNYVSYGLFTIWNVRLQKIFHLRQTDRLNRVLLHVLRAAIKTNDLSIGLLSNRSFCFYACNVGLTSVNPCLWQWVRRGVADASKMMPQTLNFESLIKIHYNKS